VNKLIDRIETAIYCAITLATICCIAVIVIVVYGITHLDTDVFPGFDYDRGCLGDAPSQQKIEEWGGYKFPASVQNIWANSVRSWEDCVVLVSFEMADDDLGLFLESTLISSLTPQYGRDLTSFKRYAGQDADWSFDSNRMYFYGKGDGNRESQWLVVDRSSTESYTAYIITHLE
jgi:hypothetical protein